MLQADPPGSEGRDEAVAPVGGGETGGEA